MALKTLDPPAGSLITRSAMAVKPPPQNREDLGSHGLFLMLTMCVLQCQVWIWGLLLKRNEHEIVSMVTEILWAAVGCSGLASGVTVRAVEGNG